MKRKLVLGLIMIMSLANIQITTDAATTHYAIDSYTDVAGNEIVLRPIDVYDVNGTKYIDVMNVSHLGITFMPTNVGAYLDLEMVDGITKRYTWNNLTHTCELSYLETSQVFVDGSGITRTLSSEEVPMEYDVIVDRGTIYVPLEFLMTCFNMSYDPYGQLEPYSETYNETLKTCPSETVLIYPNEYYYTEKYSQPNRYKYKSNSELQDAVKTEKEDETHKEVKLICDDCVAYGVVISYINDDYVKVAWYGLTDKEGNEISEHDYPSLVNDAYKYGFRIDATTVVNTSSLS